MPMPKEPWTSCCLLSSPARSRASLRTDASCRSFWRWRVLQNSASGCFAVLRDASECCAIYTEFISLDKFLLVTESIYDSNNRQLWQQNCVASFSCCTGRVPIKIKRPSRDNCGRFTSSGAQDVANG